MMLFTDYIEPLTQWLYAHPNWALFMTFLIAFTESLAIIGSIIPGSVTMTAVGIMAGSGIMRIDLTFLAATLGAIAGDSGSYALGYIFSDRLTAMWPFKNYPKWIDYGKSYFAKHGATSVLIGRFVGPMRSIIPVIAGMMHMKQWKFLTANILSGIGWAILYVAPGVLIGAASSELSPQTSTRLFVLILVALGILWFMSLTVKWLLTHTRRFLKVRLHGLWLWLKRHSRMNGLIRYLTPKRELNHFKTAGLIVLFLLCLFFLTLTLILVIQEQAIAVFNHNVYLFFQSLATQAFDKFFVAVSLMISPLPLITIVVVMFLQAIYYRDWRTCRYWLSLVGISGFIVFLLTKSISIPSPLHLPKKHAPFIFPDIHLSLATAWFSFVIVFTHHHRQNTFLRLLSGLLVILLMFAGLAAIYLGNNWLTTILASYLLGLSLSLGHWIFYRRLKPLQYQREKVLILMYAILAVSMGLSCWLHFKKMTHVYKHYVTQYMVKEAIWWNQQQPLLPVYSSNRIGHHTGLFNIQYLGSLQQLEQALTLAGWKRRPDSFFYSLLIRASGHASSATLPLTAQLYQNKKPVLVMTYNPEGQKASLTLRLWRSNYHIPHHAQPIWLGSISNHNLLQTQDNLLQLTTHQHPMVSYQYLIHALKGFKFNQLILPANYLQAAPPTDSAVLLLIKEPQEFNLDMGLFDEDNE